MHKIVERLIGQLVTDPELRRRFAANPARLLQELKEGDLDLTEIEIEALANTNPTAIHEFASALDARLLRASIDDAVASSTLQPHSTQRKKQDNSK